jgi:hypothetical protein
MNDSAHQSQAVEMAAENILSGWIWGFGCSSFTWSRRVVPVNSIRPSHEFEKNSAYQSMPTSAVLALLVL